MRTFVQVSDLHFDSFYVVGSNASNYCHSSGLEARWSDVLNRRTKVAAGQNGALSLQDVGFDPSLVESYELAGEFGTRGACDSPWALLNQTVQFVASLRPVPDFVLWTGDNSRHDHGSPERSWPEMLDENRQLAKLFGEMLNIPVFPSMGNNDVCPTLSNGTVDTPAHCPHNQLSPGPNDVLTSLESIWSPWLSVAAQNSFSRYGYYEMPLEATPSLTLLNLNTISWMPDNTHDPEDCTAGSPSLGQMQWLNTTLADIQAAGGRALLQGHVPPIAKFIKPHCAALYAQMAAAYRDSIAGHLYGHVHSDTQYELEGRADIVLCCPSVVPSYNPSVRVFHLDPAAATASAILRDYDQYYADLDEANDSGKLVFQLEYRPSEQYGLRDLSWESWQDLYGRMAHNATLAALFERFVGVIIWVRVVPAVVVLFCFFVIF
jgi:hypothetical protein